MRAGPASRFFLDHGVQSARRVAAGGDQQQAAGQDDEQLQHAGPGGGQQAAVNAIDARRQGDDRHARDEDPGGAFRRAAQPAFTDGPAAGDQRGHQHAENHEGQHHRGIDAPRRAVEPPLEQFAHAGELFANQVGQHDPEQDRIGQEIAPAERGRGHARHVGQSGHAQQRLQSQPGAGQRRGHGIPGELPAGQEVIVGDIEAATCGGQPHQDRRGQQQHNDRKKKQDAHGAIS